MNHRTATEEISFFWGVGKTFHTPFCVHRMTGGDPKSISAMLKGETNIIILHGRPQSWLWKFYLYCMVKYWVRDGSEGKKLISR